MNPGQSPAVAAALARRNTGGPVPQLQQVSPSMPMASGTPPSPIPQSAMDKSSAIPTTPKAPSQKYQPQNQSDMITQALIEQLKGNNQLEKEKLKVAQGQSIQPPTPQVPSFNQASPQNAGSGVFGAPASMSTSQMQGGNPLSSGPF
jgi:hypothetical protein